MLSSALLLLLLSPLGITAQRISRDATCSGTKGYTCLGSYWGNCCSQYGYCGKTSAYCGTGCKPGFGTCNGQSASSSVAVRISSSTRSSSAAPSATQVVSRNARCGPSFNGQTCLGSAYGDCCSQYSYCGSTNAYCDADTCQKGFGKCNTVSSSSSVRQSSTSSSARSSTGVRQSSSSSSTSSSVSPRVSSSSSVSSSVPPSSTTAVTSTSASPSSSPALTCVNVPSCQAYTGSLTNSCSSSDNKCQGGYQARCGDVPSTGSVFISQVILPAITSDACATACTADSNCVAFSLNIVGTSQVNCILFSQIGELGTGPFGSSSYLKTCDTGSVSSSSTVASSSSSAAQSSSSSIASSTPVTSSSLSTSPTPAASSSSSTFSTSTVSGSPADPTCIVVPNCTPFSGALTESCNASNDKCQGGYQSKCSQVPQEGSVRISQTLSSAGQGDACAATCTGMSTCVGFVYAASFTGEYYCNLFSKISYVSTGFGSTHLKVCPDSSSSSSAVATSSSSSMAQSSASSITSSTTTTPGSSTVSSTSIASSSATPSASPSATSPFSSNSTSNSVSIPIGTGDD